MRAVITNYKPYLFLTRMTDGVLQELWHFAVLSTFKIIVYVIFVRFVEDFWGPVVDLRKVQVNRMR